MSVVKKKAGILSRLCVACGCCVRVCPFGALNIIKGTAAAVDTQKCRGCGKCAQECPAGIIEMRVYDEEQALV